MTLRFTVPNSGIQIEGEYLSDIENEYVSGLGGNRDFFGKYVQRAITALEHGPAAGTVAEKLGGTVIEGEPNDPEPSDPDAENQEVDDPWASHPSARTTQNAPPRGGRPQGKPQPQGSTNHRGDPAQYLGEDRWANRFYKDANAPECNCGVQAIRGAFTSQQGKKYGAYVCFDAGPKDAGADYRNKCDFREFINTKKGR